MEIFLQFGGFYNSVHDALIESLLESFFEDSQYYDKYDIDYQKIREEYAKIWLSAFNDWLIDNNYIEKRLEYKELWSPQYYNFQTDEIMAVLDDAEVQKLNDKFLTNKEFLKRLKEYTKSRDGYISTIDYEDAINNEDNCLAVFIFKYLCEKFKNDFFDFFDFGKFEDIPYLIDNFYQVLEG